LQEQSHKVYVVLLLVQQNNQDVRRNI